MKTTIIAELSSRQQAVLHCLKTCNREWEVHSGVMRDLLDLLPHGSGIDGEWCFDSKGLKHPDREIVLRCAYHSMNDVGMYDGWTHFKVTIRATFSGADVQVTGRFPKKYADSREYLEEVIEDAVNQEIEVEITEDKTVTIKVID